MKHDDDQPSLFDENNGATPNKNGAEPPVKRDLRAAGAFHSGRSDISERMEDILRDIPHARNTDPDTSHEAAARVTTLNGHCAALLRAYGQHPEGLTAEEAAQAAAIEAWAASKRASDLRRMGLIETVVIDGKKMTRLNSSNRRAEVAAITLAGRTRLQDIHIQ